MAESVTLASVLDAHHRAETENAHTAIPCKVVSYSASDNTVAAQPLVKRPGFAADGTTKYEEIPTYPHVPVAFPRAGNFVLYVPVAAGSYGTLVFFDMSPGEALSTGQLSEPQDVSRHAGGYCFFIPGVYPFGQAIADNPDHMYIGVDGDDAQAHFSAGSIKLGKAATDFVALASLVSSQLDALKTVFTSWTPVPNDGGAALKALLTTLLGTGWPNSVAATVTKAQ